MSNYYDGLNLKLLGAIPAGARRVLELGCANGRLGRRYKELNPGTEWWGVDLSPEATAAAEPYLDRVFTLDLDSADLSVLGAGFDVVVIGDLLEHLQDPGAMLESLYDLTREDAQIICCLPNMSHLSVIERLVAGDISYDEMGLLDKTHTRFFSPSSAFKTFLDSGWLPHLQDQYRSDADTLFATHIYQAAASLGIPEHTARYNMGLYQMILSCQKWPMQALARGDESQPVSVIVPVNRPWQYELNIARSPGLREVGADIICVHGATSAADAYAKGAVKARHPWRVMAHQDVYFPVGTGYAIAQQLGAVQRAGCAGAPVGFAGVTLAADGSEAPVFAGLVVDRKRLFRHPRSDAAVSLDELAIALHRDSPLEIDPSLGWHMWATDLCLQAQHLARRPAGQVLDVPIFHNSTASYVLPDAFRESSTRLLAKYPQFTTIKTLFGMLSRPQVSSPELLETSP
jgi:ubiquinone/menaquinone biosynthesis C-methylase UbiE